jgi:hypothetical protein
VTGSGTVSAAGSVGEGVGVACSEGVGVACSAGVGVTVGADAVGVGEAGGDGLALAAVTLDPRSIATTTATMAVEAARVRAGRAGGRRDENMSLSHDDERRVDVIPVRFRAIEMGGDRLFESYESAGYRGNSTTT